MDPLDINMAGLTQEQVEDCMREIIFGDAQRGSDGGGKDDGGKDLSNRFLNDSGEGVELEEIRDDDEMPLANSGEVYIY